MGSINKNIIKSFFGEKKQTLLCSFLLTLTWFLGDLSINNLFPKSDFQIIKVKYLLLPFLIPLLLLVKKNHIKWEISIEKIKGFLQQYPYLIIGLVFYLFVLLKTNFHSENWSLIYEVIFNVLLLLGTLIVCACLGKQSLVYQSFFIFLISLVFVAFQGINIFCNILNLPFENVKSLLGSSFSTKKILFFGLASAVFLLFQIKGSAKFIPNKKIWFFITFFYLTALLSTDSKSVLVGLFIFLIIFIPCNCTKKKIYQIIYTCTNIMLTLFIFFSFFSQNTKARFNDIVGAYEEQRLKDNLNTPELDEKNKEIIKNIFLESSVNFKLPNEKEGLILDKIKSRFLIFFDPSHRLQMLKKAFDGFIANPFFGLGFNCFELSVYNTYSLKKQTYNYPHNLFAEMLFSTGSFGTFLFLCCLVFILKNIFESDRDRNFLFFAGCFVLLSFSFFSGNVNDFAPFFLFCSLSKISEPLN